MPSTQGKPAPEEPAAWRQAGLRLHSLRFFLQRRFGCRVQKLSVDGGFSCPNVDGTLARGGCVFCNIRSFSPSRRMKVGSIQEQMTKGIRRLRTRYGAGRFIAYFQPATNTHAPTDRLRELFEEALAHPEVVGVAVGTRPDCVPDSVLDLLEDLSRRTWVSVEYGLQSIHDHSLDWMNRGHRYGAFLDAVARSRDRGLHLGAHVILGLPGETRGDMRATASEIARLGIDSVKLHNLYAVRDTPLAEDAMAGRVMLPTLEEYVGYAVDFVERLPPQCVVERLSGDAPPEFLVAPPWCANKPAVLAAIFGEFERRNTWQGRLADLTRAT